jgi:hypothetical protein
MVLSEGVWSRAQMPKSQSRRGGALLQAESRDPLYVALPLLQAESRDPN